MAYERDSSSIIVESCYEITLVLTLIRLSMVKPWRPLSPVKLLV